MPKKTKETPSPKAETPADVVKKLQDGEEEIQGFTQLMQRINKATNNLTALNTENPVEKVKGKASPRKKNTGPKTPITGTKDTDHG